MLNVPGSLRFRTLCLFAAPALLWAAKKPVTIDVILGQKHGAGFGRPIWSPDGASFIHEKARRLFLYDVRKGSDQELLSLEQFEKLAAAPAEAGSYAWQNRRVSEESVQWSADGKSLLVAAKGDLFLWSFGARKAEQLTATPEVEADPRLSPDGARVAFRRGHDLYSLDIASKRVTRLTSNGSATLLNGEPDWVYPEELDLGSAYWWSPDGQKIAYMQFDVSQEFVYPQTVLTGLRAVYEPERYPQAGTPNAIVRVGVIAPAAAEPHTEWLNLGGRQDDLIARVDWLRDSRRLAVQRMNRVQNRLELLIADSSGAAGRTALEEKDPYWINLSDCYRFLRGSDQFIWSSERDGHRHLWLYSFDGEERARLTRGDWDVEKIAGVDEQRRLVYYVSSEGSPVENQLWRVSFDGSGKTRISSGAGNREIDMAPAALYFTETFSNLTTPPRTTLHASDGREIAALQEPDRSIIDQYDILPSEIVQFRTDDGTTLYGKLTRPSRFRRRGKYPAIVEVYGGPGAQSVRNAWHNADWAQVMAHRGFVIWSLDNRGSAGRGHAFESPLYRRFGKTELADQQAGVRYLLSLGFVDPARVGITGWSYGGFMTLYSMFSAPEMFRAGVAGAPVTNWHNYDTIYTERYLGLPSENEDGYRASSAVTYAGQLQGRLLIVHNIEDDNVLFQNTVQVSDALETAGRMFSLVPYMEKTHGLSGPVRGHLYETMTSFFERELNPRRGR